MRLAIISDIHEDLVRLKRIIGKIDKKGYDSLVCLGDISGFSLPYYKYEKTRNAKACLTWSARNAILSSPGIMTCMQQEKIPELSDIFPFPENWYEMDTGIAGSWQVTSFGCMPMTWTYGYGPDDLEFFRGLPEYEILETPELNIFLSHYASPNLSGFRKKFYTMGESSATHFQEMEKHDCLLAFIGHAHPQGIL